MRWNFFKLLRGAIFALVALVTLVALFYAVEDWRGKHAWEKYQREAAARGVRIEWRDFVPPQAPDGQNFAMTPLLRPLFPQGDQASEYAAKLRERLAFSPGKGAAGSSPSLGNRAHGDRVNLDAWREYLGGQDLLAELQKFDPELREITAAARQPYSRFPIAYEKGFGANLPHITVLIQLSKIYTFRALAELHAGQPDAACADLQTAFRLGESVREEPMIISELVRFAIWQNGVQCVWDGLEDHRWSEAQLAALQDDLSRPDFIADMLHALQAERAFFNDFMLQAVAKPSILPAMVSMGGAQAGEIKALGFIPNGWIYQNMITVNRFYDTVLDSAILTPRHRALQGLEAGDGTIQKLRAGSVSRCFGMWAPNPYTVLAAIYLPALNSTGDKAAYSQTTLYEAVIACALERYRLANGTYPDVLEKLSPAFLQAVPNDVVTGEPLHYRVESNGGYLLYSVGSNGKDDGGKAVFKGYTNTTLDMAQGDWVWSLKPLD